ncbi:MAG: hypothetical protein FJZ01_22545 [Candidatus Sericytochromatia bacterium]|nr:hypothetical protein [Candidatus Tanganyikabacteria bacterium]
MSAAEGDPRKIWLKQAREGAVLLPTRHYGLLRVRGKDRAEFLHSYTTQDIKRLRPGQGCTSAISNWRGTVTDFVRVLARRDDLLILGTPGRQDVVRRALQQYIIGVDVALDDWSATLVAVEIAGPQALHILPAARDLAVDAFRVVQFAPPLLDLPETENPVAEPPEPDEAPGTDDESSVTSGLVVRTEGLCGGGVLVVVPHAAEHALRERLRRLGATAVGDDVRDLLRIAEGIPEFGRDIGEDTNVWEARLDRSVSLDKGCYLGQEIVARLHNYQKVQRFLVGLRIEGGAAPAAGTPVEDAAGAVVGNVTSAADDGGGGVVALAMMRAGAAVAGTPVRVEGRIGAVADFLYWSKQPV